MKTILLQNPGPASTAFTYSETPKPVPAPNEVLVKTHAISINPVDAKTRDGKGIYGRIKDQSPLVLGWDLSGIVEAVGDEVVDFKAGDAVFGMINFPGHGRAYAEYVAAPADQLALKPHNISHQEAAAATLAALTAYQVLRKYIKAGDRVLIQSAAGGVGHFAVQIAKILGASVTAITSTKNLDFVEGLGADDVIDYTKQPFESVAKDFDFALDTLSGDMLYRTIPTVKRGGDIISLPSAGFSDDMVEAGQKAGINIGFQMVQSNGQDMKQIADWLASGQLKAEVAQTFPFNQMAKAHLAVESGRTRGKIVVTA